jgi:hypothetical protein
MVYLGSQLSLHVAGHVEILILQTAPIRWHKEGSFGWRTRLNDSGVAGSSSGTEVDSILDNSHLRGDCSHPILQPPMWDTEEDSQPLQSLESDPGLLNNFSEIAFATIDLPSDPQISSNISGASTILGSQLQQPQPQFHISLPYSDGPSTASNEQSIPGCLHTGVVIDPPPVQSFEPRIHPSTVETELPKESDEEPRGNGHKEGKATEQPTGGYGHYPSLYGWWLCCYCRREINPKIWGWHCPDCTHAWCMACTVPPPPPPPPSGGLL